MKIDFSKFKKTKEDERSTELLHPHGHTIRIAHNGLKPELRRQLKQIPLSNQTQNFVEGGEALPVPPPTPDASPEELEAPPPETPFLNESEELPPVTSEQVAPSDPAGTPPQKEAPSLSQAADDYAQQAQAAIGTGIRGENQKANVLGQIGQQEAVQHEAQHKILQKAANTHANAVNAINTERVSRMNDIANTNIDPQHIWTNHSKVSTAIGLILGGIGGGLTGEGNPALKFLENQMEMDLKAQTANLGKKKSLLEASLQQYGNLHDATLDQRIMQNDLLANKIAEIAGKNANPLMQAQAKILIAPLMQKSAELTNDLALRKTLMSVGSGGDAAIDNTIQYLRLKNPEMAKEMESRRVPGVGLGKVPVPEKVRDEIAVRHELDQKLGRLEAFAKKNGGALNPGTKAEGTALAQDAQDAYRRANGQGVFREAESKFVNNMVDEDPTKFFASFRTLPGYRVVREGNRAALNNRLKLYGLPESQAATASDSQMHEGKTASDANGNRIVMKNGKWVPVK